MTRGTSSSQVGLFSTQISEQIVRLRALSRNPDGPSEAHQVDLRRAIMATRLLAGSARIMQLDVLQQFLEELLEWLQRMEQATQPLNTTQALILESVVELEESLMIHLDEVEQETGADLSPFQSQVDDLLTLIRHNSDRLDGPDEAVAPSATSAEPDDVPRAAAGPEGLEEIAAWWEEAIEDAATEAELVELESLLEPGVSRLKALQLKLRARIESMAPGLDPGPFAEGLDPVADPAGDPVFGRAVAALDERATSRGISLHVDAFGDSKVVAPSLHERLGDILAHLSGDVVAGFDGEDADGRALRVTLTLREEDGRALLELADDAPRVHGSPLLGDPDHLSMLTGLRRARVLLDRTPGLIRVTGDDARGARFGLSVPLDPDRPRYRVLTLEGTRIAVPAALVDEVIDASGLLYETDESGESVDRDGRSVPLADLAFFVDEVVPASGPSPRIAVVGSVEKRVGLGCEDDGRTVETRELQDAPSAWAPIAYGAIEVDDERVPVLDLKRLLALRFRLNEALEEPGALADPRVDSFVPAEEPRAQLPDEVDFEPEARDDLADEDEDDAVDSADAADGAEDDALAEDALDDLLESPPQTEPSAPRELRTALLVNQSEFRRRDLARTLETLGLDVTVRDDLGHASRTLEAGDVDLLVTDLRLGQGGGESFHTLRQKHPDLTIVLTSSVAQQYADELATKTGAHRCWLDPYRKSDLDALLGELTG